MIGPLSSDAEYAAAYRDDWDAPHHRESRERGRHVLHRENRALEECLRAECRTLLDVGSLDGYLALEAARRGIVPTLVDVEPRALSFALARFRAAGMGEPAAIVVLAENLCRAHGEFDAVVCTEVVEHVRDPQLVVRRLRERARRLVVLTTPVGRAYDDPLHLHHWDDEVALRHGLGLDELFASLRIERIPSDGGGSEDVFLVVGSVS